MKSKLLAEIRKEKKREVGRYIKAMEIIDDYILAEFDVNKSKYITLERVSIRFYKDTIEDLKAEIAALYDDKTTLSIDELEKFIRWYVTETNECVRIKEFTAFNNDFIMLEIDVKKICLEAEEDEKIN